MTQRYRFVPRTAMALLRAYTCILAAAITVPALIPACAAAPAEVTAQSAVNFAHNFLRTDQRGREVLGYLHFGADYHGHEYLRTVSVVAGDGREVPDDFALVYRFHWENDGVTDLAFLCDGHGYVYKVQVVYTNAVFSQPFSLANVAIQVLGNALIQANKDSMTELQRRVVQKLVDDADAKGLLEWELRFEQTFGD